MMRGAVVLILGIIFAVGASAAIDPSKIAIIDMQGAIQGVQEGKKVQDTLRKELEKHQKKIATETEKIQTALKEFEKQSIVLDEKARAEKQAHIQGQMQALQELKMKSQMEFQNRDRELSGPIIKKVKDIVGKLSKERGYTLVLDGNEGNVIYAQGTDDITSEVVKIYDSKK